MSGVEIGEHWAYRTSTSSAQFHEVEVVIIGEKRPPKVKIKFVDDKWEGKSRWIPRSRLEVPWAEVEPHRESVSTRAAVWKASNPGAVESRAADSVLLKTVDVETIAWLSSPSRGVLEVYDLGQLANLSGIDQAEPLTPPVSTSDGVLYLAWPVTLRVAQALAANNAGQIMAYAAEEEARGRRDSIMGREVPARVNGGEEVHLPAEDALKSFEKIVKPELDLLRKWAVGEETVAPDVRDLQAELSRVASIAARAIAEVRRLRSNRLADAFMAELLNPLSTLERDTMHLTPGEQSRLLEATSHFEWVYRPAQAARMVGTGEEGRAHGLPTIAEIQLDLNEAYKSNWPINPG